MIAPTSKPCVSWPHSDPAQQRPNASNGNDCILDGGWDLGKRIVSRALVEKYVCGAPRSALSLHQSIQVLKQSRGPTRNDDLQCRRRYERLLRPGQRMAATAPDPHSKPDNRDRAPGPRRRRATVAGATHDRRYL